VNRFGNGFGVFSHPVRAIQPFDAVAESNRFVDAPEQFIICQPISMPALSDLNENSRQVIDLSPISGLEG
jgi:hypothetical protein